MSENSFVPLPGSERGAVPGAQPAGDLDDATRIEVTLVTRRREALPAEVVTGPATLSRDELAARHGTDPSDLALISDVLGRFGLTVTGADAGARRVTVAGPISAFSQAFGATLRQVSAPHPTASGGMAQHRYRVGGLHVPAELDGVVLAVLGLDDRPQASPQIRRHPRHRSRRGCGGRPDLLHARTGRAGLQLPRGHRRDRPDHRHHRAWRRIRQHGPQPPTSPAWASPLRG